MTPKTLQSSPAQVVLMDALPPTQARSQTAVSAQQGPVAGHSNGSLAISPSSLGAQERGAGGDACETAIKSLPP